MMFPKNVWGLFKVSYHQNSDNSEETASGNDPLLIVSKVPTDKFFVQSYLRFPSLSNTVSIPI